MLTTIKRGASKAEIQAVFSKLEKNKRSKKDFDAFQFCGKVKFEEDALEIQKKMHDEWEQILIDTNIAIYLLNGDRSLAEVLDGKRLYVSFITQLELLGYSGITPEQEQQIENMLDCCIIVDINNRIKSETLKLKRNHTIKLPDCIIAATSLYLDMPLITADKGFEKIEELDLMLYEK